MEMRGHRKIGRPKRRWSGVIRKYMSPVWQPSVRPPILECGHKMQPNFRES